MPAKTKQKTKKKPSSSIAISRLPSNMSITPPTPDVNSLTDDFFNEVAEKRFKINEITI